METASDADEIIVAVQRWLDVLKAILIDQYVDLLPVYKPAKPLLLTALT
ncbi:hypothetical protein [Pseudarthrobacter sp. NBSH8]|nr:hypothetical protein [Pseudarthrobacter sp. NBSH8]